jgi:hypothetical protein
VLADLVEDEAVDREGAAGAAVDGGEPVLAAVDGAELLLADLQDGASGRARRPGARSLSAASQVASHAALA